MLIPASLDTYDSVHLLQTWSPLGAILTHVILVKVASKCRVYPSVDTSRAQIQELIPMGAAPAITGCQSCTVPVSSRGRPSAGA